MKIGIFGGTFNPPHEGHKHLAEAFIKAMKLDKLIIIPAFIPPHKTAAELASPDDRIKMCRLCFDFEIAQVSDIEIKRGGKSYTYKTLEEIKKIYSKDELYFLMGSDMLLCFHEWKNPQKILDCAIICAAQRERGKTERLNKYINCYFNSRKDRFVILPFEPIEISSTEIRNGEAQPEKKVNDYMIKNEVYGKITDEQIISLLRTRLDDYRFRHSLNVAECAKELAQIYSADKSKAYTSGLLHDITKNATEQEQLTLFKNGGMVLKAYEKANKKLWHAMSGSLYAKNILKIDDEEIVSAIRYHTTGKAGMSLLEKIIYIADFVSAERDYNGVEEMRRLSQKSLDEAAEFALRFCIPDLVKKATVIHPDSIAFYNEIIIKKQNK